MVSIVNRTFSGVRRNIIRRQKKMGANARLEYNTVKFIVFIMKNL